MSAALARQVMFGLLRRLHGGQLTLFSEGRRYVFGSGAPQATVHVRCSEAWPLFLRGSRGMAEAYARGLWDSPDLTAVVRVAARNAVTFDRWRQRLAPLLRLRGGRGNDRAQSRRDIHAHYDLGNELFELMLDDTMMYSCAYFAHAGMSLREASLAKLDLVCDKLELEPDDHVLEIGTGWGGFAVHAATTRGCSVTTTTISDEQYRYALQRVGDAGVSDRVTVLRQDYRDLRGEFDKLVSIEMIEAVGWRDFGTFFDRCSRLLRPDGAMLLQAIVIDDRAYEADKRSRTFIRSYIFPNGCLPSMEVIGRCLARRTDMRMVGLQDLTPHYVQTLRAWRERFESALDQVAARGYDERFRRLWRLYLAYCEAGFEERRIGDVQLLLAKPRWRQAPVAPVSAAQGVQRLRGITATPISSTIALGSNSAVTPNRPIAG